tara:strand:+ start:68 stop:730 length:663 start_codon:yes stop_codon:yes gene_type:complete
MSEKTNIVLMTAPRCGSTWFLSQIENENPGMKNHMESLRTLNHGYEMVPRTDKERKAQFRGVLRDWQNPDMSNCLKVFPLMLTEPRSPWRKKNFIHDLLDDATKVFYLRRKNFPAQVKSAVIAFYKTMQNDMNFHGSWDEPLFMPDIEQTRKLIRSCEKQMYAQNYQLLTMWNTIPTDIPTELIWLEDLDQSGKYNRPIKWENEPFIESIDWEGQWKEKL